MEEALLRTLIRSFLQLLELRGTLHEVEDLMMRQ